MNIEMHGLILLLRIINHLKDYCTCLLAYLCSILVSTRPQVDDSKDLGLGRASRLAPLTLLPSNLSLLRSRRRLESLVVQKRVQRQHS